MNILDEYKTGNPGMDDKIVKALAKEFRIPRAERMLKPKQNKYSNTKTVVDGITFASKKEAKRYGELKLLEKAGEITNLILQPKFLLQERFYSHSINKLIYPIYYLGDFSYDEQIKNYPLDVLNVVEDVKGMLTELYIVKKKLFLYKYPDIIFREI